MEVINIIQPTKHLCKLSKDDPDFPGPLNKYIIRQSGPGKFIFFNPALDSITYVDIRMKKKIVSCNRSFYFSR
jgi:hypothetical protein